MTKHNYTESECTCKKLQSFTKLYCASIIAMK